MTRVTRQTPPARAETPVSVPKPTPGAEEPALPHERDEQVGMTGGIGSEAVKQAHTDVKRGLQDTSGAPEADRAYRDLKKPAPPRR